MKKKNPQDATLRNVRALKKQIEKIHKELFKLNLRITVLEGKKK